MTVCPICQSETKPLDRTGDAEGFDCPQHGTFKVGGTALSTKSEASREQWEAALKKTKDRTRPDLWPVITTQDF